ncbi:heterodisulfide reductase-related iron-sulfur binding cluster [Actinomyces respiraculi]|uniref:heterodisulfide reductase-related iron-sulfur binding cluster n=1 Tax=Actinomyces respiraculi TaxID=2744574 RepID=UPI00141FC5D7|nr:heterodisulfide reductase-related iron-sulfur binding cluster [Actinomyces respiraculi]
MTFLAALRLVCAVVVLGFTVVGVALFARACAVLVARMRLGRPAPERYRPVLARSGAMLGEVLGHSAFKGRPWIRVAHWLVMVSFPLLFLTLVTGYGQVLIGPDATLPWLDHQVWWAWTVELIAWLSLAGILLLMAVRRRLTARGAAAPPFDATSEGGTRTRTSRFAGSTARQAVFVEVVIGVVVVSVLLLRMLEHAHLSLAAQASADSAATWPLFPLTAWTAPLLEPLGANVIEGLSVVVATVKVVVSMSWLVVVGLQPSMGVAWHRFLAVVNVYARRDMAGTAADPAVVAERTGEQPDVVAERIAQAVPAARTGAKSLGPLAPLTFDGADGERVALNAETMDELDAAMEAAEEEGRELRLGAGRVQDLTWKGLLDFSTCTECGRCQDLCPAWNTGKPLSPKLFTLAVRDHHAAVAPYLAAAAELGVEPEDVTKEQAATHGGLLRGGRAGLAEGSAHTSDVLGALLAAKAAPGPKGVATRPAPLAGEVVPAEVLWSCTTCGACVDQCPVDIEHVDHVIDIRRQQVLMASAFPKELGQMFRRMETKGNPWGLAARKRLEWAKDLDIEVPVVGVDVEDAREVDYLFWVGCAGAYEDRARRTTRAVAELLHTAGVSFAVLGDGESCTGDPARRAGNEILFQMLAAQNVETLNEARAQRIVVTCAHCFNTLAREYPQVGGHYEVLHYTQLLNRLVREGRLRPAPPERSEEPESPERSEEQPTVTYHDACYLGRHNQVYSPPRELVEATGATAVEMPRSRERALCCGGGGARTFMEESIGTRIAVERSREAISTGAQVLATACPFCTTMLSDGVAAEGADVRVTDVASLMLEAVRRGTAR